MTPEDIEQLKQLKQLLDDGVLTAEEFALQKSLILVPPQNPELVNSEGQGGIFGQGFWSTDSTKTDPNFETSSGEDKYAVMRGLLASGALQAKDFSQETLSLVYGKQVDGSSKKEQNSRPVEGTQGSSTTRPSGVVDPIREMHIKMNLPKPVTKTAASTSKIVTFNTKKLVLTFSAIILVALVVVVSVIAGGSNDSAKEGDAENSSVEVSTPDIATDSKEVIVENPSAKSKVEMGQVWNWYELMLNCAVDVWNESVKGVGTNFDQEEFYNVMPLMSYMAGTHTRVAELIEKGDWPSEVQEGMALMAALQRQYADLLHIGSRKSFDEWNTFNETWNDFDYGPKYEVRERIIEDKIGVQRLYSGEPEPVSDCALLNYYEANPPDFSIVPTGYAFGEGFNGWGLRGVCGAVRDLEVPNGNNPDSHLAYINKKAQSLWKQIQADELDGPSDSKYAELAKWLVQTIDVFMQRNSPAMPLSHMYVVEGCERLFW